MNKYFNTANLLYAAKEIAWLLLTAMAVWAVLYPVTSKLDYIYWRINAVFIFITITYFRYAITFKNLPFLRPGWIRFLLFAFNLSFFIYLMHNEQKLLSLYDNFYIEDFGFAKQGVILYDQVKMPLLKYIYTNIVLFGTGSLVTLSALQVRLIISYWQYYKHQADSLLES